MAGARETAAELLEEDPGFAPAQVLAAQVDFADGRSAEVGRAAAAGRRPDAAATWRASSCSAAPPSRPGTSRSPTRPTGRSRRATSSPSSGWASCTRGPSRSSPTGCGRRCARAAWTRPRSTSPCCGAGRPPRSATLEGARAVAVARGDRAAELAAVKELAARRPGDRALLERRAELELAVGDPSAGLQIIQDLAAQQPERSGAGREAGRGQVPLAPVAAAAGRAGRGRQARADRADFAVLLYWLVPNVRYAPARRRGASPPTCSTIRTRRRSCGWSTSA